jgi:hypothetical protein
MSEREILYRELVLSKRRIAKAIGYLSILFVLGFCNLHLVLSALTPFTQLSFVTSAFANGVLIVVALMLAISFLVFRPFGVRALVFLLSPLGYALLSLLYGVYFSGRLTSETAETFGNGTFWVGYSAFSLLAVSFSLAVFLLFDGYILDDLIGREVLAQARPVRGRHQPGAEHG